MKLECKRCISKQFEVPEFSNNDKRILVKLKSNNKFSEIFQILKSTYLLDIDDAKFSYLHINTIYSECNRCNFKDLKDEYITCPKCKSLNYNWKV